MKLKEYQGKRIFQEYGIKVPEGFVVKDVSEIDNYIGCLKGNDFVVKAQLLLGGRGKAGLIKFANKENIKSTASALLEKCNEVLIEEKIKIEKELYVSIAIDRAKKDFIIVFCPEGGMDIEEVARVAPEKILKIGIEDFKKGCVSIDSEIAIVIAKLLKILEEKDCELVEINPLVVSNKILIAADSKIIIDDNSLFRHDEFMKDKEHEETLIEKRARDYDLNYVELEGDIAIIGNGAGLVMATLDVVKHFGGEPANFLDVGGGASVERMEHALEVVLMKQPNGIFINIFGGITKCDDIANGIVNYSKTKGIKIPLVVRMIGTNELEGKKILEKARVHSFDSMEECAKKIVELI